MNMINSNAFINELNITDSEIEFYKKQGYLPLPGLIATDSVKALRQEILDILDAYGISYPMLCSASTAADKLQQFNEYLAGSMLDTMINGPAVKAVASRLLGGPAYSYLPFTAVKAAGGGGQFHFHQDNNYTQHEPALGSINIWVALVDMTPDNGCLQVIPRSHHEGVLQSRDSDDGDGHQQLDVDPMQCLPVRMRAGDAVAFTRLTVHGSGANTTDTPRVAYALQFHRNDVKWHDHQEDQWKLLTESPRFSTPPVEQLGLGTGKA